MKFWNVAKRIIGTALTILAPAVGQKFGTGVGIAVGSAGGVLLHQADPFKKQPDAE